MGKTSKSPRPIEIWHLIVAILALLVAIYVGGRRTVIVIQSNIAEVGNRVKAVEKTILANQFTITDPDDNATVDLTDLVRGKTPFSKMNHYIVITPLKTGDDWVEDGPVKVYTGGLWTGRAQFGTAAATAGEQFIVRALATKSTLSPGPLTEVPEDAIFSESITVTRKS